MRRSSKSSAPARLRSFSYRSYIFAIASQAQSDKAAVVKMLAVTEGISVDNRTEITSGLSAGDEIVVKGQTLLNDGAKVNILGAVN